jgi:hypothetical protein
MEKLIGTMLLASILGVSHASGVQAQDATPEGVHAVIGLDGSITYYVAEPASTEEEVDIDTYLAASKSGFTYYQVSDTSGEDLGIWIEQDGEPSQSLLEGVHNLEYSEITKASEVLQKYESPIRNVLQVTTDTGELAGYWMGESEQGDAEFINLIEPGWTFTKSTGTPGMGMLMASAAAVPIPEDQFLQGLSNTMVNQARLIACNSSLIPEEISVGASISASVGFFVVGGDGAISFSAKWMTAQLCQ